MESLSKKQQLVYNYIYATIKKTKIPPTVREICEGVDLKSPATIQTHLEHLEKKGYIKRSRNKSRSIELTEEGYNEEIMHIPIIGKITAGEPILAVENIEGSFPIHMSHVSNKEMFMLRIKGDSMINAGINNNDLVLVEKQDYAVDRDIVVAVIGDSATVKRYYREKDGVRLQPENDLYEAITYKNIIIQGKVIGLFRTF